MQVAKNTGIVDSMMYALESRPTMSNEEILRIIDFMDDNGSGEVDESEFAGAVRAAKRGQIQDEQISKLMARVDNELRIKQIRLKDLFKQLDQSGDGVLSTQELQFGLNMLCDVSWEKECERRRLKRIANHERWKNKEEVRDRTKDWLQHGSGLPDEFMKERDYFCRDIKTPERFDKYLEVVVSGPSATIPVARSPKRATMHGKQTEELNRFFKFAFDPEELEKEDVHEHIKQIVDDELSIKTDTKAANDKSDVEGDAESSVRSRRSRRSRKSRGRAKLKVVQDSSSIVTPKSQSSSTVASSLETATATKTLATAYTTSSHSTAMLQQIRRSRGVKEQSDSEIESITMSLGLNRRSVLSMKQRHFEERTFKNLYKARTSSLSNDYYLPKSVLSILAREELIENSKSRKGRRGSIMKIVEEEERRIAEEQRLAVLEDEGYGLNYLGEIDDDIDSASYTSSVDDDMTVGMESVGEASNASISVLGFDDSSVDSAGSDDISIDTAAVPSEIRL